MVFVPISFMKKSQVFENLLVWAQTDTCESDFIIAPKFPSERQIKMGRLFM
jgi:hypothetical protein